MYHTAVTVHFTPEARTAHRELLLTLSKQRRIVWLRAERGEEPRLRFTDLTDGRAGAEIVLGDYHPPGTWLRWHHHT